MLHLGVFGLGAAGGLMSDLISGTFIYKFWNKRDNKKGEKNKKEYDLDQLKERMRIP